MSRANVVLLIFSVWMASAMNAAANGVSSGNISAPAQATADHGAGQIQSGEVMNVPLLVIVDARGQVRDIQHSQRLPTQVNDLLWQSVKNWTKASAVIDGRHEAAQVFMNVTLHAVPQSDGKTNVYFTLASEGPVLRGYWRMWGGRLHGFCSSSTGLIAGEGGKGYHCASELVPASASSAPAPASP
ncbi:hypothetical protein [Dyella caseinilytica]|uniref:Uncharacterized protein n=1 Tax=Dyella caseinilytica TaxID=1849581 RepID=A0ABX7GTY0_9GAMM|nr:hypothetical protein [Dyella caseinilytica]QRN53903.1 hypothetical protein ISN74_00325 [Dyella caseinilytica]GFZ90020.1 hypothetical protein GCM10011408_06370 [Dyella caseinilytica]